MAKRTYIPLIIAVTKRLCQVINTATPTIQRLYPSNGTLLAALTAANTACSLLNAEANAVREFGD